MKKIISIGFLLFFISCQVFAADANDLVLIYRVSENDKNQIYNKFVKNTIVAEKTNNKPRNYHVTLGWIRQVGQAKELRSFMKKELKNKEQFIYYFAPAALLHVAPNCPEPSNPKNPLNKKCTRNAVVLFPAQDSLETLKIINRELNEALERYNEVHGTKYKMDTDLLPKYFAPHITLANTSQIKQKERKRAINEVNSNMKDNNNFISVILNKK
ncbi:hypothetical protein [Legionella parisiensis]|uniref:RNA 2',3'-cyclic phosphodiesterase n=1 Tax=Legionella parisiensis TaxID=45071 RepID=A0A1E5JL98_9GAMM|nr:hypothetical protein [Legionella parisiensis]KTD43031.1 hypothetical protein Lpar_1008 [Legionella parisiensis]OEH45103.1 hypothetical protein lpari_03873 [Legionella parisiensis]STX77895.1 Uncharacterised protein [Legionella parisiensis]